MYNLILFSFYSLAPLWLLLFYFFLGKTDSWSENYYKLKEKHALLSSLFTLMTWSYAIPAVMLATTPLMIFAGAAIAFVGAAPDYRFGLDSKYHGIFAKVGVALSQLSIIFELKMWWLSLITIAFMVLVYLIKKQKATYIIECIAYASIWVALLITNF